MIMLQKNDTIELEVEEPQKITRSGASGKNVMVVSVVRVIAQFLLMAAILFGGFFLMNRLIDAKEEPPSRPPFKTVYTVDTVVASAGDFQPNMIAYGEVQASKTVDLRSLVAGKIVDVNPQLRVGGRVEKGELLFQVDRFNYETALASAQSNATETRARIAENEAMIAIEMARIESLREQLELAQSDLERITRLQETGSATTKAVEDRKLIVSQRTQSLQQSELNLSVETARKQQLQAVLARFERSIQQAQRDLEDTSFLAPMTGVVSENNASEGRLLGANDMVISMYRDDLLEVRFTLTDQRFGRIQSDKDGVMGREVEVIWSVGGEEFRYPAVIDRIGAQITSDRGGVEVIARIQADVKETPLRPGAFVEIIVPDKVFEAKYKIPETALYDNDTVYVDIEGQLVARKIRLLARDGNAIIVEGELNDGERVLTTRIAEISEGLNVRPPEPASQN